MILKLHVISYMGIDYLWLCYCGNESRKCESNVYVLVSDTTLIVILSSYFITKEKSRYI